MDIPLIVGLASAGMALLLLAVIECREDEEPLPPPRMDLIKRGLHDNWVVSRSRVRNTTTENTNV